MHHFLKACVLTGVLGLAACGSSSGAAAGGSTASSMAAGQASSALAAKLGIPPFLVEKALSTAKSMLAGGSAGAGDKARAAQAGVDAAAAQAESEGKPLVAEQKSGLLEGMKNML